MKVLPAVCCAVLLAACTRTSPYRQPIDASSPINLSMWRADADQVLTREESVWIDWAFQEYRYQIMANQEATGSEGIDAALRGKIDGKPLGDVVRAGLGLRLARLTSDRDEAEKAFAINSRLQLRPDQTDTARKLAEFQHNLGEKLAKLNEDVSATDAALRKVEAMSR